MKKTILNELRASHLSFAFVVFALQFICPDVFSSIEVISCNQLFLNNSLYQETRDLSLSNSESKHPERVGLNHIFGSELKLARDIEISMTKNSNWQQYLDFQITWLGIQADGGILLFRIPGESVVYSVDARVPQAREIISEVILKSPPPGYRVSPDQKYFISTNPNVYVPSWGKELGIELSGTEVKWPTPERMNEILRMPRDLRFTRKTDDGVSKGITSLNIDLVESLAAGEIPVSIVTHSYDKAVARSYVFFYKFTQCAHWPEWQRTARAVLEVLRNPNAMARMRYNAESKLNELYSEIFAPSIPQMKWSDTPLPLRLAKIEADLKEESSAIEAQLSEAPLALSDLASPSSRGSLVEVKLETWFKRAFRRFKWPLENSKPQTKDPLKTWLERYQTHDISYLTEPLRMAPDDLVVFLDDQIFKKTFQDSGIESNYMYWLKEQLTNDFDSSGHSILGERIRLKMWIYQAFPELHSLSAPAELSISERKTWLAKNIASYLGASFLVPRVPLRNLNSYQSEASKIYFDGIFQDAFGSQNWDKDIFRPEGKDAEPFLTVLGLSIGASEVDIKTAYRKLVMQLHPDRTNGDKAAEAQLKNVNLAYGHLSGKSSR